VKDTRRLPDCHSRIGHPNGVPRRIRAHPLSRVPTVPGSTFRRYTRYHPCSPRFPRQDSILSHPRDIRLVFIDVDGTLVGTSRTVLPAVWAAADAARAAGVRLAISSGRPGFGGTRDMAGRLDPDGWHCFQNGASVMDLASGRSLSTPLPPASVDHLIDRARTLGRALELYTDVAYACEVDSPRTRAHADLLDVPFRTRAFESLQGTIVRAQWVIPIGETDAVMAEPHPGLSLSPSVVPSMPDTRFVNITADGVTKATATRVVAEAYGVPLEQVMFVGDGWNDAEAMRIVGWPVAMGNAEEQALAVARHVVGHVDEGGLAEALHMILHTP
jgi:Cof subfamily protein (haloacid dehalogenase superfamily)